MASIIQRSIFFAVKVLALLVGFSFGLADAFLFSAYVLGPGLPHQHSLLQLAAEMIFAVLGILVGYSGMLFLVVLPLHFCFPEAAKPFSWARRDPPIFYGFLRWYGQQLQTFAARRTNA
jgi:hypothetical protein